MRVRTEAEVRHPPGAEAHAVNGRQLRAGGALGGLRGLPLVGRRDYYSTQRHTHTHLLTHTPTDILDWRFECAGERGLHDAHMSLDVFGAPAEPAFWSAVRITTPRDFLCGGRVVRSEACRV